MKSIGIVLITVLLFSSGQMRAQKQINNQSNTWLMYVGNHKLNDKWSLHTLYHFRRSNDDHFGWQQSLLRGGVNYRINNDLILSGGADWVVSFPYGAQRAGYQNNEYTAWQAALVKQHVGRLNLVHRYRLEQRFIERYRWNTVELAYAQDGFKYANRFRYWLNANVPINHKTMTDKTWYVNVWDEIFVDLEPGPIYNLLNQNRLGVNLGYQWHKGLNLQVGYMDQLIVKSDALRAERNYTIMVQVQSNLDLRNTN